MSNMILCKKVKWRQRPINWQMLANGPKMCYRPIVGVICRPAVWASSGRLFEWVAPRSASQNAATSKLQEAAGRMRAVCGDNHFNPALLFIRRTRRSIAYFSDPHRKLVPYATGLLFFFGLNHIRDGPSKIRASTQKQIRDRPSIFFLYFTGNRRYRSSHQSPGCLSLWCIKSVSLNESI